MDSRPWLLREDCRATERSVLSYLCAALASVANGMGQKAAGSGGIVERLVARLALKPRESEQPGSGAWLCQISHDVEQARRNDADRADVIVRREGRISRARDRESRVLETLALGHIVWRIGLAEAAEARLRRALSSGPIPEVAMDLADGLLFRVANRKRSDGRIGDGIALYEQALDPVTDARDVTWRVTLLYRLACLHLGGYDFNRAELACHEGLQALGRGNPSSDPYRVRAPRPDLLDGKRQHMLVHLVEILAICNGYKLAFDSARKELDDLRTALSSRLDHHEQHVLAVAEGYLNGREGHYADAEQCFDNACDLPAASGIEDDAAAATTLVNLGCTYLELDRIDEACGVARRALGLKGLDDQDRSEELAAVRCLEAECALRREDLPDARRHAQLVLAASHDPLVRSGAWRVMALATEESAQAIELARRAVDVAHEALGPDLFLVRPLLTLAKLQRETDPVSAETSFRRALDLPIPSGHPYLTRACLAFADHLDGVGRQAEAAALRKKAEQTS